MEGTKKPPRAYVPSRPAVKSSQPQVSNVVAIKTSADNFGLQRYEKEGKKPNYICVFFVLRSTFRNFAPVFYNNKVETTFLRMKECNNEIMRIRDFIIVAGVTMTMMTSCFTPKTVAYFPELNNGETLVLAQTKGIVLKPTDKLSIVVNTKSVELNNVLNLPVTSQIIGYSEMQSINQSKGTSGYTIDQDGYIDFPLTGRIKAAGLTRAELAQHLKQTMEEKNVAKDAVVTVEYLNLGYSVIGEVKEPGFYPIESDRTTLMQALSRAGDMTIYGDRNKVKVLRMNAQGTQDTYVLSMLDAESLAKSPAYIVEQNDVIYVQPNNYRKRQSANASDTSNGSFWISVVSVLTTIAVLIFK